MQRRRRPNQLVYIYLPSLKELITPTRSRIVRRSLTEWDQEIYRIEKRHKRDEDAHPHPLQTLNPLHPPHPLHPLQTLHTLRHFPLHLIYLLKEQQHVCAC